VGGDEPKDGPFFGDEDLQVMRRNVMRYFVKCMFSGRSEELTYQVDEKTADRVRRNVSGSPNDFCCFSTLDGREVAINLARLDFVHFLWDATLPELAAVEHLPTYIYFSDREEAFYCDPEDGEEAFNVFFLLELGVMDNGPFLALTDEDGEIVVFDARHIDAIEMSSALVAEGAAKFDEESGKYPRNSDASQDSSE
jgi:hypothetical protein